MRLGLLPGAVSGSGGPSTYVTGFVRALPEVRSDVEIRALLLGAKHARWRARGGQARVAEALGAPGAVKVVGRPLPAGAKLYNSRLAPLLPSYDTLFGRHHVYHQTHLDVDPAVPGDRLVLTLHDLVAEHWPDEGRLLPRAGHVLSRAAAVITVSARSREDILSRFPAVAPDRLHVVWNGVDHDVFHGRPDGRDAGQLRAVGVQSPFLLYAGGLTRRKNVETLLKAHGLLRRDGQDVPVLVLVGPWDSNRLAEHAVPGAVMPVGMVPRETVAALMRAADAVVLPSLEEGFGLPVLEAQACGSLVVCSDIPAFREVGGSAPFYVQSLEPRLLAHGLRVALLGASAQREKKRAEAMKHAAQFSWRRSAEGHVEVYERVMADSARSGRAVAPAATLGKIASPPCAQAEGVTLATSGGAGDPATVVVITWNRPTYVESCLSQLERLHRRPDEVLVVDASPDTRTAEVVSRYPWVKRLPFPGGAGHMTASRNEALHHATGDVICFLDDDVRVRPEWLNQVLNAFAWGQRVGAVAGRTLNGQPGEETEGVDRIGRLLPDGGLTGNFAADPGTLIEVDHGIGANMSFRRSVLALLGGFRDDFPGTALREDTDIYLRVRALGYRSVFAPDAVVEHVAAPHVKGNRFDWRYLFWGRHNHALLLARNCGLGSPQFRLWLLATAAGSLSEAGRTLPRRLLRIVISLTGTGLGVLTSLRKASWRPTPPERADAAAERIRTALNARP